MDLESWLNTVGRNPGVIGDQIGAFESSAGIRLPDDYRAFLASSNGAEGAIGAEAYVALWKLEDLVPANQGHEVHRNAPGIFLFGSDGGGEGFGFDLRDKSMSVVNVPLVGMSPHEVRIVAPTFTRFLEMLESSAWLPF